MYQITADTNLDTIELTVDGQSYRVPDGVSVAAALLLLDLTPFRVSPVDQSARAPYCLMGVCCECLVDINGVSAQLACQVTVEPGMRVSRRLCP